MTVKTYTPQAQVIIYKTRDRGTNGRPNRLTEPQEYDITPLLGQGSQIGVMKSLYHGRGSWYIQVPDQPYSPGLVAGFPAWDSLYGLIEPLDEIEIRLSREPQAPGSILPLLMRGFVQEVRRLESMSATGQPHRMVTLQGADYGVLFEITVIPPVPYWTYTAAADQAPPGGLNIFEPAFIFGSGRDNVSLGEFLQSLLTKMVNPHLEEMSARYRIKLNDPAGVQGKVYLVTDLNSFTGPIWRTMQAHLDLPWNELWLEDPEDGTEPVLQLRPAAWRTWIKNGQIQTTYEPIKQLDQSVAAEGVLIDMAQVRHIDALRSDHNVANMIWVYQAIDPIIQTQAYMGSLAMADDKRYFILEPGQFPNCDKALYGWRLLEHQSVLFPDDFASGPDSLPKDRYESTVDGLDVWGRRRRQGLAEMNADNVLLEEGSMTVMGNHRIRPGRYVIVQRGQLAPEYYATQVTHRFAPFQDYSTTFQFIRGTGFLERVRSATPPHLREGKQGPY